MGSNFAGLCILLGSACTYTCAHSGLAGCGTVHQQLRVCWRAHTQASAVARMRTHLQTHAHCHSRTHARKVLDSHMLNHATSVYLCIYVLVRVLVSMFHSTLEVARVDCLLIASCFSRLNSKSLARMMMVVLEVVV